MNRMEATGVKGVLASFTSFFVYIMGLVNEVVVVLIFFMMLDFVTGMFRAYMTKTLNSTLGLVGIFKKIGILVVIGVTGSIEYIFISMGQDPKGLVLLAVTSFFVVNEGLSILENCAQLGIPIPPILFNALEKLHRDPLGKEAALERDPLLDNLDKKELMKENKQLQQEVIKEKAPMKGGGDKWKK
ncbi:phage holin family protein [Terribacillus saccharophilus]|uniref:phage holin family protein n=1 Tax=Terribacillus saccharophilus TaxID=361277 RepID=UPI002DC84648|nr:phage holin family protein [Terribacillus saccharophilus]MEC0288906.1 phage holin family protein [Terribacillus saccharophilus]